MEVVYLLVFQRGSCLTKPLCSYLRISIFSRHQIPAEQGTHTYFFIFKAPVGLSYSPST